MASFDRLGFIAAAGLHVALKSPVGRQIAGRVGSAGTPSRWRQDVPHQFQSPQAIEQVMGPKQRGVLTTGKRPNLAAPLASGISQARDTCGATKASPQSRVRARAPCAKAAVGCALAHFQVVEYTVPGPQPGYF